MATTTFVPEVTKIRADWLNAVNGAVYDGMAAFLQSGTGAVVRTHQAKSRDSINPMDFGAVGDGVADDTYALQLAIDAALTAKKDLEVTNIHKITSTVHINRLVDSAAADKYFTIWGGGGFYCDTAITMFGTSLAYSGNPNSQLVRFHNVSFDCLAPETTAYCIDGNKFLRTIFDSCSFVRIKLLVATTYTQSIYLYNCNARRWLGSFFHCLHGNYDLQVIGGLYEAGQTCFDLVYPRGSKFYTQIEGMQEWALKLAGCSAVHISCYFEDNGTDFDCRNTNYPNKGVNIQNCFVVRSGGFGFIWGTADACISEGNYSTGNNTYSLHDLQSDSNVAINDFCDRAGGLSNEDAVSHSGYRQGNLTSLGLRTDTSASYTITNLVGSYTRMGKVINCIFKCTMTSNATHGSPSFAYIVSGLPGVAENVDVICGQIAVNDVASTMEMINTNPPRPQSLTAVVPANVSTNAFTVSGNLTYFAT